MEKQSGTINPTCSMTSGFKLSNCWLRGQVNETKLLIGDQSHDHSVQVEEEHQQVEAQLDERLLFVPRQSPENLSSVKQVVFVDELVDIECKHWKVQQEHKPEAIDQEKNSQKGVDRSLRNKPWVQLMAQLYGIDIVTLQVRVHNGEKHLGEQVHNVHNDGENKQPGISTHWLL